MPQKRLVEIEWDETSGVDHPANNVEGWAVLKGRSIHHGRVLAEIKKLVDGVLARAEEDDDEGQAKTQKALLKAITEAWPAFAAEVAAIVKEHRSAEIAVPLQGAVSTFRNDVEDRMAKLRGTAESTRTALHQALKELYPQPAENDCYMDGPWVKDFDDSNVIFEYDGKCWAAPYSYSGIGDAVLGTPTEVQVTYTKKED